MMANANSSAISIIEPLMGTSTGQSRLSPPWASAVTRERGIWTALIPTTTTTRQDTISAGTFPRTDDRNEHLRAALARMARTARPSIPDVRVSGLRKWEGRVVSRDDGVFTAELESIDGHHSPSVLADFEIDLLKPDHNELALGDVVYVTLRTVRGRTGYATKTSSIRLRRLGNWSSEDATELRARAVRRLRTLEPYFD